MIEIKAERIIHMQECDHFKLTAQVTIEQMASTFWHMDSEQQAEFLHHLGVVSKRSENDDLLRQFLSVRQECEERKTNEPTDTALDSFLDLFAAAYKYMS